MRTVFWSVVLGASCVAQPLFEIESIGEEYLIGVVADVEVGGSRELYVLDAQLMDIKVFDQDGAYLRTIAQPGEGPGDLSDPSSLFMLPDGRILVPCRRPTRIVRLWPDGTPSEEFALPKDLVAMGGHWSMAGRCADKLLLSHQLLERAHGHETQTFSKLAIREHERTVRVLHEANIERVLDDHAILSSANFPFALLAADPSGHAYLATDRERYRIQRLDAELQPIGWIEREYPVHEKSVSELQAERASYDHFLESDPQAKLPEILATKPGLRGLIPRADGWLLVRNSRAEDAARESGIVGAFDRFDPSGQFTGSIESELALDYDHDSFQLLDEHLIIVRNAWDARRSWQAQFSPPNTDEAADEPEADLELRLEIHALPADFLPPTPR